MALKGGGGLPKKIELKRGRRRRVGGLEPPLKINNGGRKIKMRRLNNYMRCTMRESRMSALVLMHIKYDMPVNLDEIVNSFEGLHPRMMQFTSLVYDYKPGGF